MADLELATRDLVRTPRWFAQFEPFEAGSGAFVRVHGYGDVAVHDPDRQQRWNRAGMSFYDDWGISNWLVPFMLMGAAPLNPVVGLAVPLATS